MDFVTATERPAPRFSHPRPATAIRAVTEPSEPLRDDTSFLERAARVRPTPAGQRTR